MEKKSVDLRSSFARNNFDLLRIFAAAQVLVFHTMTSLQVPVPAWLMPLSAFPGVPIFFFVSGYLVSASYERSSSIPRYARNRAFRIFPGLWVCLAFAIGVASLLEVSFLHGMTIPWVIAQMAGIHFTPDFLSGFGIGSYNGSLWTIPVELQFYVVLPVLYFLGRQAPNLTGAIAAAFAAMLLVAVVIAVAYPTMGTEEETTLVKLLRYSFIPHVYLFLFGILMQRLSISSARWLRGQGLWWVLGYVAVQVVLEIAGVRRTVGWVFASNLLLGLVVIAVAYTAVDTAEKVLRGNDISYGVYIYHAIFINVLVEMGWLEGTGWSVAVVAAATVVCATLSWNFVEKPMLAWGKRSSFAGRKLAAEG